MVILVTCHMLIYVCPFLYVILHMSMMKIICDLFTYLLHDAGYSLKS